LAQCNAIQLYNLILQSFQSSEVYLTTGQSSCEWRTCL